MFLFIFYFLIKIERIGEQYKGYQKFRIQKQCVNVKQRFTAYLVSWSKHNKMNTPELGKVFCQ